MQTLAYHRVLLKLSGEALMGKQGYGIDADMLQYSATEVRAAHQLGGEITLVIGGGNIFRGTEASGYGITAKLWLNERTRQIHAEGVNMPRLSTVRLGGTDLSRSSPHDGATVSTGHSPASAARVPTRRWSCTRTQPNRLGW